MFGVQCSASEYHSCKLKCLNGLFLNGSVENGLVNAFVGVELGVVKKVFERI